MRKLSYIFVLVILLGGALLIAFAPDTLSMIFAAAMETVAFLGTLFGILPMISFMNGMNRGEKNIQRVQEVEASSAWLAVMQIDSFFQQNTLDRIFREYREKLQSQRESGQILSDVEDYINEDVLATKSWQPVILQIPGTLTGLGILGTFVGLITGIGEVTFTSVDAALTSVQILLNGIELAFYTSIAGVILSILFNITYRIVWNMLLRDLDLFAEEFHKNIVPPVDEQRRYRERKDLTQITELLDRLPRASSYSVARSDSGASGASSNEEVLMPQILAGMKNGEFVFYIQPRYELNSRKLIGGEALVRWNHGKLGMVSPAVFMPILEQNGYITKLDQYVWEAVCKTIREWIDAGLRPLPISVNVTKTDVLAMDIGETFTELAKKYRIPPRTLEIEIAENAYLHSHGTANSEEEKLRSCGFRVVVDGFDGNYIGLQIDESFNADALKLDLRALGGSTSAITAAFEQARKLQLSLSAEGIESMEQLSTLRKCGCTEGQGYYFSKPVSIEEFVSMMKGETK